MSIFRGIGSDIPENSGCSSLKSINAFNNFFQIFNFSFKFSKTIEHLRLSVNEALVCDHQHKSFSSLSAAEVLFPPAPCWELFDTRAASSPWDTEPCQANHLPSPSILEVYRDNRQVRKRDKLCTRAKLHKLLPSRCRSDEQGKEHYRRLCLWHRSFCRVYRCKWCSHLRLERNVIKGKW